MCVSIEETARGVINIAIAHDGDLQASFVLLPEDRRFLMDCLARSLRGPRAQAIVTKTGPKGKPERETPKGSLKPQSKQVLRYMRRFKVVTPMKALHELGVQSLSRRICDLRDAGYKVQRELKRDFRGKRYATYSLAEDLSGHVVPYAPNDQIPSPLTGV